MVELRAPAEVEGAIETPLLSVEEGVLLNSNITMRREGQATSTIENIENIE
jgi:cytoskeletal protein CcmA (bactofilin family)